MVNQFGHLLRRDPKVMKKSSLPNIFSAFMFRKLFEIPGV